MNRFPSALRVSRKSGDAGVASPGVTLQHHLLSNRDLGSVRAALDRVGEELALNFELVDQAGEILLVDGDLAARASPHLLRELAAQRPVITISDLHRGDDLTLSTLELFERRQRDLRAQLEALPLVRDRLGLGRDGAGQAPVNADRDAAASQALLRAVWRGVVDRKLPALTASYGADANLRLDFRSRLATIDPLALQQLRLQRELPHWAPNVRPQPNFTVLELDLTVWDLGMAAGLVDLLEAPDDWWHVPLLSSPAACIRRYSGAPRHLELERRLRAGPQTPCELHRQAQIGVAELRGFLQACLLLRLVLWQSPSP